MVLSKEQRDQIRKELAAWPEGKLRQTAHGIMNPCLNDYEKRKEIDLWVDNFIAKYKKEEKI